MILIYVLRVVHSWQWYWYSYLLRGQQRAETKCVQGRGSSREFGQHDIGVLCPDDADIPPIGRLDLDLGSKVFSSQSISSRELMHKDHRDESRIVNHVLNNTSRADGDTILYGLDKTVGQDRGCWRTTGTVNVLLHPNPDDDGLSCDSSPKSGLSTSGVSGEVSEWSIHGLTQSHHGLPGTALQSAGIAHRSGNTAAEGRCHTCCQGTWHDSIKSVMQLYEVPDGGT